MKTRCGFDLIDLVIAVAVVAILSAFLFPVFNKARAEAFNVFCQNCLKDVSKAVLIYAQDYDNQLPPNPRDLGWMKTVNIGKPIDIGLVNCPEFNRYSEITKGTGYGFNLTMANWFQSEARVSAYVWDGEDLAEEFTLPSADRWTPTWLAFRHRKNANIGFLDGHIKTFPKESIPPLIFNP